MNDRQRDALRIMAAALAAAAAFTILIVINGGTL